jgi:hypothetical protein
VGTCAAAAGAWPVLTLEAAHHSMDSCKLRPAFDHLTSKACAVKLFSACADLSFRGKDLDKPCSSFRGSRHSAFDLAFSSTYALYQS